MGRHDRVHGRDHKAAVVHAYEVQAMTAEQVVHLAAAGKLKAPGRRDRLRPFPIAESTVKEYARFARRRAREATGNGGHDPDDGPVPNDAVTVPAQDDVDPGPLMQALLAKPEEDRSGSDLVSRRHELSRRWVHAENSRARTEYPSLGVLERCRAIQRPDDEAWGRPKRFDEEWRTIVGRDDWTVPHGTSPDAIRQLHDLLDREEAELEALETRYPRRAPQGPRTQERGPKAA